MHIIDTDPGRTSAMSLTTNSLSPATQSDILGILQREQDRAVALLSSSPSLASLFVSYANRAAALETTTPSTEAGEWETLKNTISALQAEIGKLKPENLYITERLEVAKASLEASRCQIASLKEANATQEQDIDFLRIDLFESHEEYDRLVEDSSAQEDALRSTISELEVQRAELNETIVQQQLKISRLEHQIFRGLSDLPTPTRTTEFADIPECHMTGDETAKVDEAGEHTEQLATKAFGQGEREAEERGERIERGAREAREAQEQAEKEAKEWAEKAVREFMDNIAERKAKRKAERKAEWRAKKEAREQAKREVKERAEREKAEREASKQAERGARERAERDGKEKAEQEVTEEAEREEEEKMAEKGAKEKADRETKGKKLFASTPSTWGSAVRKNDNHPGNLSQKEQKNEWASAWDFDSVEKRGEASGSPPIIISSIPGGVLGGVGKFDFVADRDSPGSAELARATW